MPALQMRAPTIVGQLRAKFEHCRWKSPLALVPLKVYYGQGAGVGVPSMMPGWATAVSVRLA